MRNGGGPACLRLRVELSESELKASHQAVLLDEALYQQLMAWSDRYYRDQLQLDDLLEPQLVDECYVALDALSSILDLNTIYTFQK